MHYKLEKQPRNILLPLMHPHGQSYIKHWINCAIWRGILSDSAVLIIYIA